MNEKLTKNDSMSVEPTDFPVLLTTFEAMLNRNGLWKDYLHWFRFMHLDCNNDEVYWLWVAWVRTRPPFMWLNQAFIWEASDIAYTELYEIDRKWASWLEANFNK